MRFQNNFGGTFELQVEKGGFGGEVAVWYQVLDADNCVYTKHHRVNTTQSHALDMALEDGSLTEFRP